MELDGKVVLVTGAARGLGRQYCETLATASASVIGIDLTDCADTVDSVAGSGGRARGTTVDVTDFDACRAGVSAALAEFGRLDGLVNNAALYGTLTSGPFEAIPEREWEAAMSVNVTGIWN